MFNVNEVDAGTWKIRLSPISGRGTRHERRRNSDESAAQNVSKLQHPTRMAVRGVVSRRRGGRSRRAADWSDAPTNRSPSEEPDASEAHRAHAAQRSVATLRENAKGRKERRAREARARRGGAERKEASAAARVRPRAPRRRRTWGDNDSHTNERKRKRRMTADTDGRDEERFHVALERFAGLQGRY